LARVAWARGDVEEALDHVERSIGRAGQSGLVRENRHSKAQQARFWLASQQLALARLWASSCDLDPYLPPTYERQFEHLTWVRLLIRDDRAEAALRILDAIQERAVALSRSGELVEILVLRALACKEAGNHGGAIEAMERALELGAAGGYVRVFVDEGGTLAQLLRHATTRGSHREYALRLLAASDGGAGAVAAPPLPVGTASELSDRELEVLRLVAIGLPNRDIGQRLFISDKTVKKHLSNILGKLAATNRTQAVDQARRLGLF
jgi:LuxR family maltose regulon positive regulatory protein